MLAAVCRAWVVSDCSTAMLRTVEEKCMECVGWVVQSLTEQPVVGLVQQLLKGRQIWRAVTTAFAASQERVDSFEVGRRYEASPGGRGVHQPRHHYSSEDSLGLAPRRPTKGSRERREVHQRGTGSHGAKRIWSILMIPGSRWQRFPEFRSILYERKYITRSWSRERFRDYYKFRIKVLTTMFVCL